MLPITACLEGSPFSRSGWRIGLCEVRFALAEKLTAIHSVFLHRAVRVLDYIQEHWNLLLRDMAAGTMGDSIPLDAHWRRKLVAGCLQTLDERRN